jgi:hypothetical protein
MIGGAARTFAAKTGGDIAVRHVPFVTVCWLAILADKRKLAAQANTEAAAAEARSR